MSSHRCRGPASAAVVAIEYFVDQLRPDVLAIKAQLQRPGRQVECFRAPLWPCGDDAVIYEGDGARGNDDAEIC